MILVSHLREFVTTVILTPGACGRWGLSSSPLRWIRWIGWIRHIRHIRRVSQSMVLLTQNHTFPSGRALETYGGAPDTYCGFRGEKSPCGSAKDENRLIWMCILYILYRQNTSVCLSKKNIRKSQ